MNIEDFVAETKLEMEILPVNELTAALHNFVNKGDKMAFRSCLEYNLEETRNRIAQDSEGLMLEEADIIVKAGACLEERIKQGDLKLAEAQHSTSGGVSEDDCELVQGKGRKRAAPILRKRASAIRRKRAAAMYFNSFFKFCISN